MTKTIWKCGGCSNVQVAAYGTPREPCMLCRSLEWQDTGMRPNGPVPPAEMTLDQAAAVVDQLAELLRRYPGTCVAYDSRLDSVSVTWPDSPQLGGFVVSMEGNHQGMTLIAEVMRQRARDQAPDLF